MHARLKRMVCVHRAMGLIKSGNGPIPKGDFFGALAGACLASALAVSGVSEPTFHLDIASSRRSVTFGLGPGSPSLSGRLRERLRRYDLAAAATARARREDIPARSAET